VGSFVNLCNVTTLIPPASRACCDVHEALGGAFSKRHHVDFGVIAMICKVPVFWALQVVLEPRFCRYPRVQSTCRITLPTYVVESTVKTIFLKMRWIDLSRSVFFSLPMCFSPLTFVSFVFSLAYFFEFRFLCGLDDLFPFNLIGLIFGGISTEDHRRSEQASLVGGVENDFLLVVSRSSTWRVKIR
jgi:hypothetical protein